MVGALPLGAVVGGHCHRNSQASAGLVLANDLMAGSPVLSIDGEEALDPGAGRIVERPSFALIDGSEISGFGVGALREYATHFLWCQCNQRRGVGEALGDVSGYRYRSRHVAPAQV